MCMLTFGTEVWNKSAICACVSQTVSPSNRTCNRVCPSSVW